MGRNGKWTTPKVESKKNPGAKVKPMPDPKSSVQRGVDKAAERGHGRTDSNRNTR